MFYVEHVSYAPSLKGDEFSAFTVAELGRCCRGKYKTRSTKNICTGVHPVNMGDEWGCAYEGKDQNLGGYVFVATTEADARAKMLVYLLENDLITIAPLPKLQSIL